MGWPVATTHGVKLHKLTMKKFSEDVTKRVTFWNSSKCVIDLNLLLSDVDKFKHFTSYLESDATDAMGGQPPTSANYSEVINTLEKEVRQCTAHCQPAHRCIAAVVYCLLQWMMNVMNKLVLNVCLFVNRELAGHTWDITVVMSICRQLLSAVTCWSTAEKWVKIMLPPVQVPSNGMGPRHM